MSDRQKRVAAELFPAPHLVLNDVRVAFDGALARRAGVLLLAGTGSMAWAGDGQDRDIRIGGWGDAFGDEGGAYWIGREALSEATCALDGRRSGRTFAEALLQRLELRPNDVIGHFLGSGSRRSAIAMVAQIVDDLADKGHATAQALMHRAGDRIADHADAARSRLGLPVDYLWSYAGSVFASRTIMAQVTCRIGHPPDAPRLPPVGGALLRAAQLSGWTIDESWIERLSRALSAAMDVPEIGPSLTKRQ